MLYTRKTRNGPWDLAIHLPQYIAKLVDIVINKTEA